MKTNSRHRGYDNIRGILIILVVLGHFLELSPGALTESSVYLAIYSFHMPTFVFLSGRFAKPDPRNMRKLTFLYLLFQLLYRIFAYFVLGTSGTLSLYSFLTRPYWLLWYIPVLLYCQSLLPLWMKLTLSGKVVFLCLAVIAALVCGYCPQIGYPFSLSRFFVFLPYFLVGNLAGNANLTFKKRHIPILLFATAAVLQYLLGSGKFNVYMLYGSYPYSIGYNAWIRMQSMVIASAWICLLLALAQTTLNKPIPLLSYIGAHTLPVFLLHGFTVKYVSLFLPVLTFPAALVCSAAVIALTGNPFTVSLFSRFMHTKK